MRLRAALDNAVDHVEHGLDRGDQVCLRFNARGGATSIAAVVPARAKARTCRRVLALPCTTKTPERKRSHTFSLRGLVFGDPMLRSTLDSCREHSLTFFAPHEPHSPRRKAPRGEAQHPLVPEEISWAAPGRVEQRPVATVLRQKPCPIPALPGESCARPSSRVRSARSDGLGGVSLLAQHQQRFGVLSLAWGVEQLDLVQRYRIQREMVTRGVISPGCCPMILVVVFFKIPGPCSRGWNSVPTKSSTVC